MIERGQSCDDFGSWLVDGGAALEHPARWLGVLIALLGAALANPDATAHGIRSLQQHLLGMARRVWGWLARFLPFLRRAAVIHTASGNVNLTSRVMTSHARGIAPLVRDATVEEKIEALDKRTVRLDREVGELQVQLDKSNGELRKEIASTASDLRREIAQTREAIEELDRQTIHSDASALPIIVLGVVLSGLSPDAAAVPMWLGLLVLAVCTATAVVLSWRILSAWRARRIPHTGGG